MIFLTGLLPASCHKAAPQPKSAPVKVAAVATVTNVVVNPNDRNLGDLSLTNHTETYLRLTTGELCTLTSKLLDKSNVQITFSLESKNEYGETHGFAATQVIAQTGKSLTVTLSGLNFILVPHVYPQPSLE